LEDIKVAHVQLYRPVEVCNMIGNKLPKHSFPAGRAAVANKQSQIDLMTVLRQVFNKSRSDWEEISRFDPARWQ